MNDKENMHLTVAHDKRLSFVQNLNTIILTVIAILAMIIFLTVSGVKKSQEEASKELIRMKTVQDINVAAIKEVGSRVTTLELNYMEYIKSWVDANYVRKPQK